MDDVSKTDQEKINKRNAWYIIDWNYSPHADIDPAALRVARYIANEDAPEITGISLTDERGYARLQLDNWNQLPPVLVWDPACALKDLDKPLNLRKGDAFALTFTVRNPTWWKRLWTPQSEITLRLVLAKDLVLHPPAFLPP